MAVFDRTGESGSTSLVVTGESYPRAVDASFDLAVFLVEHRSSVLARAEPEVVGRHLPHYEAAGAAEISKRLAALYDVIVSAVSSSTLDPALAHADRIAADRQQSGHDLSELQRAINALEEQLWLAVMDDVPVDEQGHALGVVSTILGAIKDRLACAYVSRAARRPTRTLRVEELLRGNAAGQG
jgi:hypothetical protein